MESYLSDLTIAFLEDTGVFIGNYSNAGYLVTYSEDSSKSIPLPGLLSTNVQRVAQEKVVMDTEGDAIIKRSPGYLVWGREQVNKIVDLVCLCSYKTYILMFIIFVAVWKIIFLVCVSFLIIQGCDFVFGSPKQWSEKYTCKV